MSIAAFSSSVAHNPVAAATNSEEATESPAQRASEAAAPSAAVKSTPSPGTGKLVDLSA